MYWFWLIWNRLLIWRAFEVIIESTWSSLPLYNTPPQSITLSFESFQMVRRIAMIPTWRWNGTWPEWIPISVFLTDLHVHLLLHPHPSLLPLFLFPPLQINAHFSIASASDSPPSIVDDRKQFEDCLMDARYSNDGSPNWVNGHWINWNRRVHCSSKWGSQSSGVILG